MMKKRTRKGGATEFARTCMPEESVQATSSHATTVLQVLTKCNRSPHPSSHICCVTLLVKGAAYHMIASQKRRAQCPTVGHCWHQVMTSRKRKSSWQRSVTIASQLNNYVLLCQEVLLLKVNHVPVTSLSLLEGHSASVSLMRLERLPNPHVRLTRVLVLLMDLMSQLDALQARLSVSPLAAFQALPMAISTGTNMYAKVSSSNRLQVFLL